MNRFLVLIAITIYLPLPAYSNNPMNAPEIHREYVDTLNRTDGGFHGFYKQYVSPIDGDRCLMYPSCSTYAKIATSRLGFIKGSILTADRLTRCGSDLLYYRKIQINGRIYFEDQVEKRLSKKSK